MLHRFFIVGGLLLGLYGPNNGQFDNTVAQVIELTDTTLIATPEQRELLRYLISCALPEGVTLYSDVAGQRYTFDGSLGLAPAWLHGSLSESEQHWVSACIFARTNYFGKSVNISLRASSPAPSALSASDEERRRFSLYEGAFFGNLFLPQPMAYTCSGTRSARHELVKDRVCTERADGGLSRCGYIHLGHCEALQTITVEGHAYPEVIFTFLTSTHLALAETP